MNTQSRPVTVYLDGSTYEAVAKIAKDQRRSLSSHVKSLVEREIAGSRGLEDKLLDNQISLLIGVNALLKYHPDKDVFRIVNDARKTRLGSASDEA